MAAPDWFSETTRLKLLGAEQPRFKPMGAEMAGNNPSEAILDEVPDLVEKPSHYTRHKIEPLTFITRNGFEFWRGNIIKYASRAGFKLYDGQDAVASEITDLEKVIRYAQVRINQLRGEPIL